MSDPVIMDDGGSTRVKQILSGANPDTLSALLDVTKVPVSATDFQFQSTATAKGPFNNTVIVFIDPAGTPNTKNIAGLAAGNTITVKSGNKQTVTVLIQDNSAAGGSTKDAVITLAGEKSADPTQPFVDLRWSDGQRRYEIANAGPITEVDLNNVSQLAKSKTRVYASVTLTQ